ncbi:MAG: VOC family protein, partial [Steroidobacteraceae bacterium]|nr:VOC family protein [Steroidobacteraceae bacterium]
MSAIVAPDGSPLSAAVLSCASLERTAAFYCDVIGFDAAPEQVWAGELFERWWNLPRGSSARMCLLTASDCPIGRILLLAFIAPRREPIRPAANSLVFGLANLNFYTADVCAATARLRRAGLQFWSEPTAHRLSAAVGSPIEVVFDGPDGVAINLVELATADANTRIGQMRAYVERHGWTRAGFTPVVTTAHVARDLARARRFYEQVCRMGVLFEDLMSAERVNAFLRLPPDARTRIVFLQGAHMFGKIALSD